MKDHNLFDFTKDYKKFQDRETGIIIETREYLFGSGSYKYESMLIHYLNRSGTFWPLEPYPLLNGGYIQPTLIWDLILDVMKKEDFYNKYSIIEINRKTNYSR